jgi:tetratricopeptide (TPR) repeat protein
MSNTMDENMDFSTVQNDTSEYSEPIRCIKKLVTTAETNKDNGLHFGWKYYPHDNHISVAISAENDALRFLFEFYSFNDLNRLFSSEINGEEAVALIASHYQRISEKFGYGMLPKEDMINGIAHELLMLKHLETAHALFKLNIENYPNSANVYDSMGDYYLAQSDTLKAIEHFTKALEISDNPTTKEKMEKVKGME